MSKVNLFIVARMLVLAATGLGANATFAAPVQNRVPGPDAAEAASRWGEVSVEDNRIILRVSKNFDGLLAFYDPDAGGTLATVRLETIAGVSYLTEPDIRSSSGRIIGRPGAENRADEFNDSTIIVQGGRGSGEAFISFDITTLVASAWNVSEIYPSTLRSVQYRESYAVIASTRSADSGGARTILRRWAIVRLPQSQMTGRLFDPDFGFFSEDVTNTSKTEKGRGNIIRWRLETEDPSAQRVRKPIVFYLDPAIPTEYAIWIERGIEEWQSAFEAAGYTSAIIARRAPQGVDWSSFSAVHNVVRWRDWANREVTEPQEEYGAGSAVTQIDLRSGEIIRAEVLLSRPVQSVTRQFYVRCGSLIPGLTPSHFPTEIAGRLLQALVAHETGHALGLRDGNYGKFAFSISQLRDSYWLSSHAFTPSVMNYSRCNSLAQPGDNASLEQIVQKVGAADRYQIAWGYSGDEAASHALQVLDSDSGGSGIDRYVPYGGYRGPETATDAVDAGDVVDGATLSLNNLDLAIKTLVLDIQQHGKSPQLLAIYKEGLAYRGKLISYALSSVAGRYWVSHERGKGRLALIEPKQQRRALNFAISVAFTSNEKSSSNGIDALPDLASERAKSRIALLPQFLDIGCFIDLERQSREDAKNLGVSEYLDKLFFALLSMDSERQPEALALQRQAIRRLVSLSNVMKINEYRISAANADFQVDQWIMRLEEGKFEPLSRLSKEMQASIIATVRQERRSKDRS